MDSITIDGMEEMEFRRSIEAMLRRGQADDAANKLRTLLKGYAGEGRILPERFLSVTSDEIRLEGWDQLGEKLGEYDRPEVAMSAISIDILDPQGVGIRPDAEGRLKPVLETSYFSDSAYPFSEADREDLLDGYSSFGCEWQGNFENVDTTISIDGIEDLYGATVGLENKVASSPKADLQDIQAGSVGSCYLAVLIHQAIRDAARDKGLPRPLCVLAGSNDAYPFFDAPAMTIEEYRQNGHAMTEAPSAAATRENMDFDDEVPESVEPGGMASLESLMGIGGSKKEKKPVLTIDPDEADTAESLEMPGLEDAGAQAGDRRHIMPSIDLGDGPPPAQSEQPAIPEAFETESPQPLVPEELGANAAAEPLPFEPLERFEPLGFDAGEAPSPIDFSAYGSPAAPAPETGIPAEPIDFSGHEPEFPPVPDMPDTSGKAQFESDARPDPAQHGEHELPTPAAQDDEAESPAVHAGEVPTPPAIEEEESPAPLERLFSEESQDSTPPSPQVERESGPVPHAGEPVEPMEDTGLPSLPANRLADDEALDAPADWPDIDPDGELPGPLDLDDYAETAPWNPSNGERQMTCRPQTKLGITPTGKPQPLKSPKGWKRWFHGQPGIPSGREPHRLQMKGMRARRAGPRQVNRWW